jgi:CheY-like chemotaxis protein
VICAAETHSAETETRTILLVDDDRAVVDTFSRLLKLEGYQIAAALDPTAGLELADNIRPDAIILDMRMPLINGLQFLRQVRQRPHLVDIPVAIVTGDYFLSDKLQQEIKALGAALRFKPMWVDDLVALAQSLVAR